MLIRFEVSNFRSIAEPVELSMVAIDRDRDAARDQPRLGESLLTRAAVYGPNASGKSNLLAAITWLRDAVELSLREWGDDIPVEPFRLGAEQSGSSEFVLEAMIDGVRFEYALEIGPQAVIYEALFHYPERKRRRIFEREGLRLTLQRGLGALSGTRELLTDRTLALSVARRFDEPSVTRFSDEVIRIRSQGVRSNSHGSLLAKLRGWVDGQFDIWHVGRYGPVDDASLAEREKAVAMLRLADLGIEDVEVVDGPFRLPDSIASSTASLRLLHKSAVGRTAFELREESEGTRTWFGLIPSVLTALRHGSLMVFDELDASLHPTLSAELLRLFADPTINPHGAQLVFTSHDTSLLNHLNRDEVWLTEKRPDGSTRLGALADFAGERVRRSQNLENAYLHGRFGALPQLDQTELLRALGLIG
ncbi:hypothetical protein GCM10010112_47660 [Actinoplanes lobatus]|uniref:ATPase AAA-type core domain-containing protein n=1 Tax=Actinoplanes lobatus TaxID=113568 RepID=A0A7W7HFR2_9ACTN|nr:ATP-binding protein [Actinoplanes lobatus]MBB4749720.1 hypothetical protein [Actinoplanes lobatus]GGN75911.1 hypothetical protein GCM10010112_47660 [Actinoplanes lobatus]GIE38458.1 hypothetical protein Alo02nite_13560 [Actinoplanes lobatus]